MKTLFKLAAASALMVPGLAHAATFTAFAEACCTLAACCGLSCC